MAKGVGPPKRLEAIGFSPADYPGLTGKNAKQPLAPPRLAIERCMLMVGYPSPVSAVAHVGPWRARLLIEAVQGYLQDPGLGTTVYFQNLDPSERRIMSFLLAQAFTCWFAQRHLGIYILAHVQAASPSFTKAAVSGATKIGAGTPKKNSEPDFIGFGPPGEYHVFESKGRSIGPGKSTRPRTAYTSCRKSALAQVSRINTVLGQAPKTRNVAVWVLKDDGPRGFVHDPPAKPLAVDLKFDLRVALQQAYRFFLQPDGVGRGQTRDDGFVAFELGERRVLSIDAGLLKLLRGDAQPETILQYLSRSKARFAALDGQGRNVGPEGVMIEGG